MFETSISQTRNGQALARCLSAIGYSAYPEQITMSRLLGNVRDQGKVGFIEAPTATGKTFVIAQHVVEHVSDTAETYVIAVPTIELGHQTLEAIQRVQGTSPHLKRVKAAIILGRQEFISADAAQDLANTLATNGKLDIATAITDWLAAGAPGRSPDHPCFTQDGLERWFDSNGIFAGVPDTIALSASDKGTDAYQSYEDQFTSDAEILLVTHSMLARDLITRFIETSRERNRQDKIVSASLSRIERRMEINDQRLEVETGDEGRLPNYRRLIVDETHLLRGNFESALRTGISITSLIRHLGNLKGKNVVSAIKEAKAVRNALTRTSDAKAANRVQINWSNPQEYGDLIQRLHDAIASIKTSKSDINAEADITALRRVRYALSESLRARDAVSTIFEWSPVAAYPTISVGRKNLQAELTFLWTRLQSAALVSATLYTENSDGSNIPSTRPSIGYMAGRLVVPQHLRMESKPIAAAWLKQPVTVILPKKDASTTLIPDDDAGRGTWLDAIAEHIVQISMNASGTIVLNTRRSDSHELANRLIKLVDPSRVIDGTTARTSALKNAYLNAARKGVAPIWLAQGPAWTGLDLPDNTLDTLIITKLPFPMPNADSTCENDKLFRYGADKIAHMAMTFKQGIGRLVRTRQAGKKTFALLDPRIHTLKNASGVLKFLKSYPNIATLD